MNRPMYETLAGMILLVVVLVMGFMAGVITAVVTGCWR